MKGFLLVVAMGLLSAPGGVRAQSPAGMDQLVKVGQSVVVVRSFAQVTDPRNDFRRVAPPGCIPVAPAFGGVAGLFVGGWLGYQLGKGGGGEDPGLGTMLVGAVLGTATGIYLGVKACDDEPSNGVMQPTPRDDTSRHLDASREIPR